MMLTEFYKDLKPKEGIIPHPSCLDLIAAMGNRYAIENAPCKKMRYLYASIMTWPTHFITQRPIQTFATLDGSNWKWLIRHAGKRAGAIIALGAIHQEISARHKKQKNIQQAKVLFNNIMYLTLSGTPVRKLNFGPIWPDLDKFYRIENNRFDYQSRGGRFDTLTYVADSLKCILEIMQPGKFPTDREILPFDWLVKYVIRTMIYDSQEPDLILTGVKEYSIAWTLGYPELLRTFEL